MTDTTRLLGEHLAAILDPIDGSNALRGYSWIVEWPSYAGARMGAPGDIVVARHGGAQVAAALVMTMAADHPAHFARIVREWQGQNADGEDDIQEAVTWLVGRFPLAIPVG